jgi:triphosphoribosyl-dephospho-CoA synthase
VTVPAENIAEAYRAACLDELRAPKAGNVHDFSAGHGMTVGDFELSADVTKDWIARPGARVGTRVRGAIAATRQAVDCNTNLGIVLMSAPLALAAERMAQPHGIDELEGALGPVLGGLERTDAAEVFEAIVLASPAGLGEATEHDVREPARVTLLEAMRAAEHRDRLAWNYTHGFADVFSLGVPAFQEALARWNHWLWATAAVHFTFMSAFPDTHILREHGAAAAAAARAAAERIRGRLARAPDPQALLPEILDLDRSLKAEGHNPGTSADLTVSTLFAVRLSSGLRMEAKDGSVAPDATDAASLSGQPVRDIGR